MFWLRLLTALLFIGTTSPVFAADMSAEQSALLYDLLGPYTDSKNLPDNIDHEIFNKAVTTLKEEKLIDSGRPNFQEKGLLEKYGKALLLGNRNKEFAKEIGKINDLVAKGNKKELEQAISDLWVKAGRPKPDKKALDPVLELLYGAKNAEPQETINHIYEKPDHRVEVIHAKAGGRLQVNVIELNDKSEEVSRTVISGITETTPNEKGDELQRKIKLEKVCTNTLKTDKNNFKKLKGKWESGSGAVSTISGKADSLVLTDVGNIGETPPLRYEGTYHLGQIKAAHLITEISDMDDDLPIEVRSQLINKGYTFRLSLDTCNDAYNELSGTWSSQHVTYDKNFFTVKRVHDPYDLSLVLTKKGSKKDKDKKSKKYFIQDIELIYDDYQKRLKSYVETLAKIEGNLLKRQLEEYAEKNEEFTKLKALQRRYKELQDKLTKLPNSSRDEADSLAHEIKGLEYEMDGHKLAMLDHETKGDQLGNEWLIYQNKKEKLDELATFDKSNFSDGRPILESLKVSADGRTVLNSTHELDHETAAAMKEKITDFKDALLDTKLQIKTIERRIKWAKLRRDEEVGRAYIQNKEVIRTYNELVDNLETVAHVRVALNTAADVAEIVVEGKNPPGMLVEALTKLGEAYFVTGMGKGVTMYNTDEIFKDYADKKRNITMHADDPYMSGVGGMLLGQGKRSLYAIVAETMQGTREINKYSVKKAVETALGASIDKAQNQIKNQKHNHDVLSRLVKVLSEQDEVLSKTLAETLDEAANKAIVNQQELLREELAKQTAARIARTTAAQAIDKSMKEMSDKLMKMTVKEALEETLAQKIKSTAKAGAGSVGRGLAWDALRGSVQTAIDYQEEFQWREFLDALFISDIINKQMIFTNKEIEQYEYDLKALSYIKFINSFILSVARDMYRQYLTDQIADKTMYKTSDFFIEDDLPLNIYLKPMGSSHGEEIYLQGNLDTVQFDYMDQGIFPEGPEYNDVFEVIEHELLAEDNSEEDESNKWRPNKMWHYQLPKDVSLSDISSTGKLKLVVEVK